MDPMTVNRHNVQPNPKIIQQPPPATPPSPLLLSQQRTHLYLPNPDRTRLSVERTMMAWIRTGVSLISFGFSIYKFFQIQELGLKGAFEEGLFGPRSFGAVMILTGLGVVGLAGAQHNRDLRSMRAAKFPTPPSLALLVGALVAFLGFMGLVAVTFKA